VKSSLVLLIFLAGCSAAPVIEVKAPISIECGPQPKADPLHLLSVEPWVIEDKAGLIWIGIAPKDYGHLSENMAAILSHINQKNGIVEFYRECIKAHNNIL